MTSWSRVPRDLPSVGNSAAGVASSRTRFAGFGAAALMLVVATYGFRVPAAELETPASSACAVTDSKGSVYGNDSLAFVLPPKGTFVFRPGGPGFVEADGALGIKFGGEFRKRGTLLIRGRRVDAPAPPARAYIPRSYDNYVGGMSLFLLFPTPGCWEITGMLTGENLTFIVDVQKIGDGPSVRTSGPPSGSRVTSE